VDYPFWDAGLPHGLLMAVIAVVHVFISHFAIGGGLFLVVMETLARRRSDEVLLAFLRRLTRVFVLVTLVAGALTGVGIWFVIGLLNPAATEVLIRNFVWGWAIEWTFFAVEIAAAIVYLHGWSRMTAREHLAVGWVYFGAAWASLFVINGILAFMLTPGAWLETGDFWDGFLNPTMLPQLVLRTGVCVMLAGLHAALVAATWTPRADGARLTRYAAAWGLLGLALTAPSLAWYVGSLPEAVTARLGRMAWPGLALHRAWVLAGVLAVLLLVFGLLVPRWNRVPVAALVMACGLAWFGSFEWFRETARKPWAIDGTTWGNGLHAADADAIRRTGLLAAIAFRTGDDGADLYLRSCGGCHALGSGYRDLVPALAGADETLVTALVRGTAKMAAPMPPFLGTASEARLVARHVMGFVDGRPLADVTGLAGRALGERSWRLRCAACHDPSGSRDVTDKLADLDASEIEDLLDDPESYGTGMPPFTGDDRERAGLLEYLASVGQAGKGGAS